MSYLRPRASTVIKIKVMSMITRVMRSSIRIQEDLEPMKPFHIADALYVCAKYKINNGKITANSFRYDIASVFVCLIFLSVFVYSKLNLKSPVVVNIAHITLVCLGYFVNYCNNIIQKHKNVLLAFKTQRLQSFFNDSAFIKRFTTHNWSCVILSFLFYTFINLYSFIIFGVRDIFELFMNYCIPLICLRVLQAAGLMKFLSECLKFWLEDVRKLDFSVQWTNKHDWDKMFEVYVDIFKVYKLTEETYGPLVS